MQTSLVLTILGPDRTGLVKTLSQTVKAHQGNWQESRMVQLAGQFAGLVHVSVDKARAAALIEALRAHEVDDLKILIQQSDPMEPAEPTLLTLELLGLDRPGIINDITAQISGMGVNIEEMESEQRSAPMSSELLFYARLKLSLPAGVNEEDVEAAFEAMPDSLMVDLSFNP